VKARALAQGRPIAVLAGVLVAFAACVPYVNPPAEDIAKLGSLREVMDAQATITDAAWTRIDDRSYSDDDWQSFRDISIRIEATATSSKKWSRGTLFDHYADELALRSRDLGSAVDQKSPDLAAQALSDMRSACRSCHDQVRAR
jgi:cytochrome c556